MASIKSKKIQIPKSIFKFQFHFIRIRLPVWEVSSCSDQVNGQYNFPKPEETSCSDRSGAALYLYIVGPFQSIFSAPAQSRLLICVLYKKLLLKYKIHLNTFVLSL